MTALLYLAVIITLSIGTLAAYIYFDNARDTNIADINAQFQSLDQEILREEISANHGPTTLFCSTAMTSNRCRIP